jgi:hypothetical protein
MGAQCWFVPRAPGLAVRVRQWAVRAPAGLLHPLTARSFFLYLLDPRQRCFHDAPQEGYVW